MYKKNDKAIITITDMTNEGEGVGKADGFAFFVKDTVIGDTVRIIVTKVKKTYGYGRLDELITPSPDRIKPICPVSKQCGGCQIQSMSYDAQLKFKENKVRNNLIRIGGFDEKFIDEIRGDIIGADDPFYYRNKAQYPVGKDREGNIVTGFYAGRTHSIINNTDCALGVKENRPILELIIDLMRRYGISAYDEKTVCGLVRHILLRKGFHTGQIMVCFVINGDRLPKEDRIVADLTGLNKTLQKEYGSSITSISLNMNKENTNVIMGRETRILYGPDHIEDTLLGLRFDISPLSFYQVNPVQVEKLYGLAIEYAGIKENEEVWDICCGIGTITLAMAKKAFRVHGIEIVKEAIEDARKNAERNGIDNSEFICAPAEEYLPENADSIKADVIVMDPPRKGMDERSLEAVLKVSPSRIVYVSCDSATLARDLKYLCARGYTLEKYRPVDMFPQTVHCEVVVSLGKNFEKPKDYIQVGIDAEDYYRIKNSDKEE
ncbi:MAG: 23S rRNA (uracil(1939)-C(5))-methyltransferase RlmD [Lachnospiraceae bacterium]|nr:23S rRNA (uracil(1939)-C(5))-methyltransferase RlmD [Lachnospiraceae bacterium]